MKLSIVIVNYNVRYFLEQCLESVFHAGKMMGDLEVFVVDNNSVDGSVEMVKNKFSQVKLIENEDNVGFSSANNQAIKVASGEYILLLNPDTIVEEDTFVKTVGFMDATPKAGGLGVKMINGKGAFLPESKRGLPTPWVAFCKMTGLSRIFPKSRTFNRYHAGYLDKDAVNEVEILSGAFMLLRKEALDKTGLLDEAFFMYGEDVDLSYRLLQAGYQNFYYPETRIIHYKGESTKKGSLNYVFVFYNAMVIFAKKHFSQNNAKLFSHLIKIAIYFRATLSILNRLVSKLLLPALDAAAIFSGMFAIRNIWEQKVMLSDVPYYPVEFITIAVPAYITIWLGSVFISGGYDKPVGIFKSFQGIVLGTIFILVIYALIPESWRFSRALILLGAAWALLASIILRATLRFVGVNAILGNQTEGKNILVVGGEVESQRVIGFLEQSAHKPKVKGWVTPGNLNQSEVPKLLGTLSQLHDVVAVHRIAEIVFCIRDLPISQIISHMATLGGRNLEYKIAPPESMHMIGSSAIYTAEDLYMIELSSISSTSNKRKKRLFDLIAALCLLPIAPFLAIISGNPFAFVRNLILVFLGFSSWVGYVPQDETILHTYPKIKKGVLNPSDALKKTDLPEEERSELNLRYAKDYRVSSDLLILWRGLKFLGRK